jgi:hypothetical protein
VRRCLKFPEQRDESPQLSFRGFLCGRRCAGRSIVSKKLFVKLYCDFADAII